MAYPFDETFFNKLYTSISTELKIAYPQQEGEGMYVWYRRLLYNFMGYVQAKYEPITENVKIQPNKKPNKKKDQPSTTHITLSNETIFEQNIENCLDVVSQDSNFAIYLLIEWIPLLLSYDDYVTIRLRFDMSSTPASKIAITELTLRIDLQKIEILSINDKSLRSMKSNYYDIIKHDVYVKGLFKILSKYSGVQNYNSINLSTTDIISSSLKIGKILWEFKNLTACLFINEISLESNLIVESLTVTKDNTDKSQRKKFNGRKYIKSVEVTDSEKASGIIQTLMISIFRTFYDFDKETIDQTLFDYMFNKKELVL